MTRKEEEKWCCLSYVSLTLEPVHTPQMLRKVGHLHTTGSSQAAGQDIILICYGEVGSRKWRGYSLFALMFFDELLCEGVSIC